ncbi:hypothetical protein [Pseudomonas sp. NFX15]|uniref:hypothetical protein n=1 Tax=Pseudomonas sp. NFX15 TaxID=2816958 RepID=UPI003B8CBE96
MREVACCARLAKAPGKHKPAARPTLASIIFFDLSNHYAEFFISLRPVQDDAVTHVLDGNVMNINFAFACMIVVSFTIALVHA